MILADESRAVLAAILARRRTELVEMATDWVIAEAVDLKAQRPREETRRLVEQVISGNEAALLEGDLGPLRAFVDFVTSFRAASEFHVSTPLKGMLSFRHALGDILRKERADPSQALEVLMAADEVYFAVVFQTADLYEDKLTRNLQQRRAELEAEVARITHEKTRELDEKIETIESQRVLLSTLSWPVIRIWDGVLVMPIIGEIRAERAEDMLHSVLTAVRDARARMVIVDLTGLTHVDEVAILHLGRLVRVTGLLGAEISLVGMSARIALTLAMLDVDLGSVRSFATLHDGLRFALERMGLGLVRRSVSAAPAPRG